VRESPARNQLPSLASILSRAKKKMDCLHVALYLNSVAVALAERNCIVQALQTLTEAIKVVRCHPDQPSDAKVFLHQAQQRLQNSTPQQQQQQQQQDRSTSLLIHTESTDAEIISAVLLYNHAMAYQMLSDPPAACLLQLLRLAYTVLTKTERQCGDWWIVMAKVLEQLVRIDDRYQESWHEFQQVNAMYRFQTVITAAGAA